MSNEQFKISGKTLENQASLLLNKRSLIDWFINQDDLKEDAALLYKQAASKYFTEKDINNAMRCLKKSTQIYSGIKTCSVNVKENIKLLIQYNKSVDNCDSNVLIKLYKELADIYSVSGDMMNYNEQHIEIAKILEKDNKCEEGLEQLSHCVDDKMYEKVLEKKADLLLKIKKYNEALKIFQAAGEKHIEKSKTVGSIYARPLFFMSMLCAMATKNLALINDHFNILTNIDHVFQNSNEGKRIEEFVKALNDCNIDDFTNACKSYESCKKFTPQQIEMLLLARELIDGVNTNNIDNDADIDLC